jgi:hypothetical protein
MFLSRYESVSGIFLVPIGVNLAVLAILGGIPLIYSSGKPWRNVVEFFQETGLVITRLLLCYLNVMLRLLVSCISRFKLIIMSTRNMTASKESEQSYEYSALKSNEIRLLYIVSHSPSELASGHLITIELEKAPAFEAVSYVWGTGGLVRTISVDGRRLDVTESAYSIMTRRRQRLLWIDQVCINQNDLVEREAQVRIMGEIYKRAWRVTAWLGPSSTGYAVQAFMAELRYLKEGLGLTPDLIRMLTAYMPGRWLALSELFRNAWFTRAWIVQEAAFSRELHLFYGDVCIDWDSVCQTLEVLLHNDTMLNNFHSVDEDVYIDRSLAILGISNARTMREFRRDTHYKRLFSLSTGMRNTLTFRCSDPRDKIYSLSMIFEQTTVEPDYTIDTRTLYTRTMLEMIRHDGTLDGMHFAGTGWPRLIADLPSWVPDWNGVEWSRIYEKSFCAGTAYEAAITFDENRPLLISLEGWMLDHITHTTSPLQVEDGMDIFDRNEAQKIWLEEAEALAMRYGLSSPLEARLESFVRSLLASRALNSSSGSQCLKDYGIYRRYLEDFELANRIIQPRKWKSHLERMARRLGSGIGVTESMESLSGFPTIYHTFQVIRQKMRDIGQSINYRLYQLGQREFLMKYYQATLESSDFISQLHIHGNRFCVTELGRMVIAPPGCRIGDTICIMKGARMPFILRRKEHEEGEGFELVGCCHVQGAMDGEQATGILEKFDVI